MCDRVCTEDRCRAGGARRRRQLAGDKGGGRWSGNAGTAATGCDYGGSAAERAAVCQFGEYHEGEEETD